MPERAILMVDGDRKWQWCDVKAIFPISDEIEGEPDVHVTITGEGIIVDAIKDNYVVGTWGMTAVELLELVKPEES